MHASHEVSWPKPPHRAPVGVMAGIIGCALVLVLSMFALALRPTDLGPIRLPWISDRLPGESAISGEHLIPGAYLYQQQRPLSCEFASATIAATMLGYSINEYDFDDIVGRNDNPHLGYRGDILGHWGNTTDYGVYTEPLSNALSRLGVANAPFYSYGDATVLRQHLADGHPVVVWLAMRGAVNSFDAWDAHGNRFQLTRYMHVMTAYGFDDNGAYLTDPGTAVWRYYPWGEFISMWSVMDGMGLAILPR